MPNIPQDTNDTYILSGSDIVTTRDYTIEALNDAKINFIGDVRINDETVGTPPGGYVTAEELEDALVPYITEAEVDAITTYTSVKSFGALGNGVADDTSAIQAAITSLTASNGGTLYFPQGRYNISSSLNFTGFYNIKIYGDGHSGHPSNPNLGSQIYMTASNTPILKVASSVDLSNLTLIYATQQTTSNTNSTALECNNLAGATVRNVTTWNSHIGFGIPQVAFAPTAYNASFDSRFENVRSYTASMTHFDLRNFNGGGTNCRFSTIYINGGGSLDFVTPGQSCNYGIRLTSASGYEFGSVSVDGLIVNERVIDAAAGSNLLTFTTLRTEAVTIAKDNDGWFVFGGNENITYFDGVEIKNTRWLPVATATYIFRTSATRINLEVKALRINTDCNLGGAGIRRTLFNSTTDNGSEIKFWSIYDPGTKLSDTIWNDAITTLLQPVTVWNGSTVNQIRRAGRSANTYRSFVATAIPTTGTYAVDDELTMDIISAPDPVSSYRCIVAGTPGTWRPTSWIVGMGTTGNRPTLTASDIGVVYLDTTLDANGRPIWWNGSIWVDPSSTSTPVYVPAVIATYSGTSVTAVIGDANKYLRFTGTNPTFTVPLNASVPFPLETEMHGVGTATAMTIAATGGVTLNKARTLVTVGADSVWSMKKVGTDEWDVYGDFV